MQGLAEMALMLQMMLMLQLAAPHSADAGVQAYMLPWHPGTHRELLQSDALAPSAGGLAELPATTAAPQTVAEVAADTICGAKEYYCGTSDMILDAAYSALTAGGCSNDTGMVLCGDPNNPIVMVPEVYAEVEPVLSSCPSDCSNSAAATGPTNFYWDVSAWGGCSVACGSGLQTRDVLCFSSIDGSQVGNGNCDAGQQPVNRRQCNATPCEVTAGGLNTSFTEWGLCSASCGSGFAARTAFCRNPEGDLADLEMCSDYSGAALSQTCTGPACGGAVFSVGDWTPCSEKCNTGNSTRSVQCVDASGKPTDSQACAGQFVPPSSLICNTVPCVGHAWQVGAWGNCSQPCGTGVANRSVICIDSGGATLNSTLCPGLQPEHQAYCLNKECDFCSTTDCSKQGECRNNVCVCTPGYRGDYCEINPSCSGLLDVNGNCCPDGVVSATGVCCGDGAALDRNAECCTSGRIDACGACDGQAKLVDAENRCCTSGVLDAGGFCCDSGALDDCGVCDGDSQSCALHVVLTTTVTQESALFQANAGNAFANTFARFAASVLQINQTSVHVTDFVLMPGTKITGQQQGNIAMMVDFLADPADSFSTQQDLRAALATRRLQDAVGQTASNQLFILQAPTTVARVSVCGNQVCEHGERPTNGTANGGCPEDCLFSLNDCPYSVPGQPCSNAGWCMSATGICQCYLGYTGDDCSQCDQGYLRSGGTTGVCARYVKAALPPLDRAGQASVGIAVLAIGIVMTVVGVIFMIIAVVVIARQRREIRRYRAAYSHMRRRSRDTRAESLLPDVSGPSASGGSLGVLDVARSLSAGLQNLRKELSASSAPQSSAGSESRLNPGPTSRGLGRTLGRTPSGGKQGVDMRRAVATRLSGKHSMPAQPAKGAPVQEVPGGRVERTYRSNDTVYANKGAQFLMASDAKVKHKLERRMSRNRTSPRTTAEDEAKSPRAISRLSSSIKRGVSQDRSGVPASPFESAQGPRGDFSTAADSGLSSGAIVPSSSSAARDEGDLTSPAPLAMSPRQDLQPRIAAVVEQLETRGSDGAISTSSMRPLLGSEDLDAIVEETRR